MTPSARCQAAIEILEAIDRSVAAADTIVKRYFRARRYAGGGDRRAIQALIYTVLRKRGQLDWWAERHDIEITSRSRVLFALLLVSPWDKTDVPSAFEPGKFGPPPLDQEERLLIERLAAEEIDHPAQLDSVAFNFPAWLEGRFCPEIKTNFEIEMKKLNEEAELDLRVNTLKSSREDVLRVLREEGITAEPLALSPHGIRLSRRRPLTNLSAFRNGYFEPQAAASQLASLLVGAQPRQSVLDLCAGAGGKALAVAADMGDSGRIVLHDTDEKRLHQAEIRLRRAGVENFEVIGKDKLFSVTGKAEEGKYDIVIIDAPCSGSGVWRRNPEAKWRLDENRLAGYVSAQQELLDAAARFVRPGGRIIYMTCSLIAAENRDQIERLLMERGNEFTRKSIAADWRRITGLEVSGDGFDLTLTPAQMATDGFYVAILERNAA